MDQCCAPDHGHAHAPGPGDAAFRRVLWIALLVNAAMFAAEAGSSLAAGSTALLADSLDFFADAANYAISLYALALGAAARSRAALVKGATMGAIGLWVLGAAALRVAAGGAPDPLIMGPVALLALAANVGVALILYRHRDGDANRQSAWLCSRNDAIGNIAVIGAAGAVAWTGTPWPDLIVAAAMASLFLHSATLILRQALREKHAAAYASAD